MAQITTPSRARLQLSLDYRIIVGLLLVVIAAMLVIWKPWQAAVAPDRTIKVTGEATLKAEPDEFVFYPSYQFKNASQTAALAELGQKSDELVAKLKSLGVADKNIKTNSDGYQAYSYYRNDDSTITYTLRLTITVGTKDLAQKVVDYLITTSPMGSISPQAQFSDAKRKELEANARDQATKNARAKADQSAKNLGFKVGKVKSIEDGSGFDRIYPLAAGAELGSAAAPDAKLSVQPGENDLTYSVTVTYFVR